MTSGPHLEELVELARLARLGATLVDSLLNAFRLLQTSTAAPHLQEVVELAQLVRLATQLVDFFSCSFFNRHK